MNAKISVFVICVAAIIYLLLYNLHGCTFKYQLGSLRSKNLLKVESKTYKNNIQILLLKSAVTTIEKESLCGYFSKVTITTSP